MVTGWSVAAVLLQTRLHHAQIANCIWYNALNRLLSLILERRKIGCWSTSIHGLEVERILVTTIQNDDIYQSDSLSKAKQKNVTKQDYFVVAIW